MQLIVNGDQHTLQKAQYLSDALLELNITHYAGIAVAVNDAVIPKMNWPDTLLHENDRVLIIHATAGG